MYNFLARLNRQEPIPGIVLISLELIRDKDTVEVHDGDEFVTVILQVDPFKA